MSEIHLSPRELEVLKLTSDGKTSSEIASILGVSYHTACANKERLKEKFEVYRETSLIAAAFRSGVLK